MKQCIPFFCLLLFLFASCEKKPICEEEETADLCIKNSQSIDLLMSISSVELTFYLLSPNESKCFEGINAGGFLKLVSYMPADSSLFMPTGTIWVQMENCELHEVEI